MNLNQLNKDKNMKN